MKTGEKAQLAWSIGSHSPSREAFTLVYREHQGAVRAVLFRFGIDNDLEDLVQDVFLKAYRRQEAFRNEASYRTWLLSIAINTAKDYLKQKRLKIKTSDASLDSLPAPSQDPDLISLIQRALSSLDLNLQELIILCSQEGYSMQEAAAILHIPEGTVKSRLATAKDRMRAALEDLGVFL